MSDPDMDRAARGASTSQRAVLPGDLVALVEESEEPDERRTYLLRATSGPGHHERVKGIGVIDLSKLAGLEHGARFEHGTKTFRVYPPSTTDLLAGLARKAQIIRPKDSARILLECDVRAGSRVVEAGLGSAALTTALARAVLPTGRVTTYEIRDDFLDWGRENLARAGLLEAVDLKLGDVTQGIAEREVDAVVLDIPNPNDAVKAARDALRGGGMLATYSPLVSQVDATHRAIRESGGFGEPWTIELIERAWVVGERGSRPDFGMLGHTAFLTFARRVV